MILFPEMPNIINTLKKTLNQSPAIDTNYKFLLLFTLYFHFSNTQNQTVKFYAYTGFLHVPTGGGGHKSMFVNCPPRLRPFEKITIEHISS